MSIKDMKILDFSIVKNRQFSKLSSATTNHQIFESIKNNETSVGSWLWINPVTGMSEKYSHNHWR